MKITLTDEQICSLARAISSKIQAIEAYYKDPKNEEDFQRWLLSVEINKQKSTETSL